MYDKCKIKTCKLDFLGHEIGNEGLSIHQDKVEAIQALMDLTDIHDLRRVLCMFNYLGTFNSSEGDIPVVE